MDEQRSENETASRDPRTRPAGRHWAAWGLVLVVGCQSYEPRPLDLAAHRAAWHGRTLEDEALAAFLDGPAPAASGLDTRVTGFDPADGLSLHEGRLVALVFSPHLRLARLRAGRAAVGAEHAGLWADPELSFSVLRITRSVPDPWVLSPVLAFTLPLSGRLDAAEDLADVEHRAAGLRVRELEWEVWRDVGEAWVAWSEAQLLVAETERLLDALAPLVGSATELAARGELVRTEAALFSVEEARQRNALARLRGELAAAEHELRAQLGLAPEAPVVFVPSLAPGSAQEADVGNHPTLVRLREEYEVAEAALRREVSAQYPDLSLGPEFESDAGQPRIGLLGGLTLPLWNANRRAIAEARADRELARAAFETGYESLAGRRAAAADRAEALAAQRAGMEATLVPLAEGQLADAVELLRLGEGSGLVLLESLRQAHAIRIELARTRASEARARNELAHLTGPPAGRATEEEP